MGPVLFMLAVGTHRADLHPADAGKLQLPTVEALQVDAAILKERFCLRTHQRRHGLSDFIPHLITAQADAGADKRPNLFRRTSHFPYRFAHDPLRRSAPSRVYRGDDAGSLQQNGYTIRRKDHQRQLRLPGDQTVCHIIHRIKHIPFCVLSAHPDDLIRMLLVAEDKPVTADQLAQTPVVFPNVFRIVAAVQPQIQAGVDPAGNAASTVGEQVPCFAHSLSLPWQYLYFFPLPQGQGSLRPTFLALRTGCFFCPSPPTLATSLETRLR